MEENTDISDFYRPVQAIVVHRRGGYQNHAGYEYYLEHHPIEADASKRFRLGAGIPLEEDHLYGLVKSLSSKVAATGGLSCRKGLPENVLALTTAPGGERIVWWTPAQRRHLSFKADLGLPNGLAHCPAMVWQVTRDRLNVYALAKSKRPQAKEPLMMAPFFNVSQEGLVCMGSAQRGKTLGVEVSEAIDRWERAFFQSEFSHLNGGNVVGGNLASIWHALLLDEKATFPVDRLKKCYHPATLDQLF